MSKKISLKQISKMFHLWNKKIQQNKTKSFISNIVNSKILKFLIRKKHDKNLKFYFSKWLKNNSIISQIKNKNFLKAFAKILNAGRRSQLEDVVRSFKISKKNKLLKRLIRIKSNKNMSKLSSYLDKLKNQVNSSETNKKMIMRNVISKYDEKTTFKNLLKYFTRFKNFAFKNNLIINLVKRIKIGINLIETVYYRKYFKTLQGNTKNQLPMFRSRNSLTPRAALKNNRKNLAKVLFIREILLKKYFKRWRQIFFDHSKFNSAELLFLKLKGRKMKNFFKNLKNFYFTDKNDQIKKTYQTKNLLNLYSKSNKESAKVAFNKWKTITNKILRFIKVWDLICKSNKRKTFYDLIKSLMSNENKRQSLLKSSKRINLKYTNNSLHKFFSRWKESLTLEKISNIKKRLMTRLIIKLNNKFFMRDNLGLLQKYFDKFIKGVSFKNSVNISDLMQNLKKIRLGTEQLQRTLIKINGVKLLKYLQNLSQLIIMQKYLMIIQKVKRGSLLANYFIKWKSINELNFQMEANLRKLIQFRLLSAKNGKFCNDLKDIFKLIMHYRINNANKIQKAFKKRKNILKSRMVQNRNFKVGRLVEKKIRGWKSSLHKKLLKWNRILILLKIIDSGVILNKFIRQTVLPKIINKKLDFFNKIKSMLLKNYFNSFKEINKSSVRKKEASKYMRMLIRKKNLAYLNQMLKRYFSIWRETNFAILNQAAHTITDGMRKIISLNNQLNLRRSQKIEKLTNKVLLKVIDKRKVYFYMWKNFTVAENVDRYSRFIQKFLRKKLKNKKMIDLKKDNLKNIKNIFTRGYIKKITQSLFSLKNNNKKNRYYGTAVKKISKLLLLKPFLNIKNSAISRMIKRLVVNKIQLESDFLCKYYLRWKLSFKKINNDASSKIANLLRINKYRQKMKKNKKKHRFLDKLTKNLISDHNSIIKGYFIRWNYKTNLTKLNNSATKIQSKLRGNKAKKKGEGLRLFDKLNKMYRSDLLNKLTQLCDSYRALKLNIKLTSSSQFAKRYITNNFLERISMLKIRKFIGRIIRKIEYNLNSSALQKSFNIWKINAKNLFNSIIKVQSILRSFLAKKNLIKLILTKNRINQLLGIFLKKFNEAKSKRLRVYFKKYLYTVMMKKLNYNTKIIQNALRVFIIKKRVRNSLSEQKIMKLVKKIRFLLLVKTLKQIKQINQLVICLKKLSIKKLLNRIKDNSNKNRVSLRLFKLYDTKQHKNILVQSLENWKKIFQNIQQNLKSQKENAANKITRAFLMHHSKLLKGNLMRRLFLIFKLFKKLNFMKNMKLSSIFEKWKKNSLKLKVNKSVTVLQKFLRGKIKGKDEKNFELILSKFRKLDSYSDKESKLIAISKLYKIYSYKVLKNLCSILTNKMKKLNFKESMKNIKRRIVNFQAVNSQNHYKVQKTSKKTISTRFLSFKANVHSLETIKRMPNVSSNMKMRNNFLTIPSLTNLINKLILKRKSEFLHKLQVNKNNKNSIKKFDLFTNVLKTIFIKMAFNTITKHSIKTNTQSGLRNLLKKYYLYDLIKGIEMYSKYSKLCYLIKLTFMHKKLAKYNFIKEILKKWRFCTLLKSLAKKKLTFLYKNMHTFYLNVADEIFGNENTSMKNNIEEMSEKFGYFNPEDQENLVKKSNMSNLIKNVSKRYSVANDTIDDFNFTNSLLENDGLSRKSIVQQFPNRYNVKASPIKEIEKTKEINLNPKLNTNKIRSEFDSDEEEIKTKKSELDQYHAHSRNSNRISVTKKNIISKQYLQQKDSDDTNNSKNIKIKLAKNKKENN